MSKWTALEWGSLFLEVQRPARDWWKMEASRDWGPRNGCIPPCYPAVPGQEGKTQAMVFGSAQVWSLAVYAASLSETGLDLTGCSGQRPTLSSTLLHHQLSPRPHIIKHILLHVHQTLLLGFLVLVVRMALRNPKHDNVPEQYTSLYSSPYKLTRFGTTMEC